MSLTDRDRKIVLVLAPLLLLLGYWFLVLSPQRAESTKVTEELTKARGERDTAQAQVGQLNAAKASFVGDYQTVIRMGKAVPDRVDMPSLLVQLDRAARGTGIDMDEIVVSPEVQTQAPVAAPPTGGGGPGAGGTDAKSMPGRAAQGAGNAVNTANAQSGQAAGTDPGAAGAAGGAGAAPAGTPTGTPAPGLSSIGLQFKLRGEFFDMADFFHRMKRFVRVVNDEIVIRGRLIAIDNWAFKTEGGRMLAEVGATVYLSPKAEGGVSAGASPTGPASTPGGGGTVASDPGASSPPTATASP